MLSACATEGRVNGAEGSLLGRVGRYVGLSLRRWATRRTIAALENLDDEILKDIGIDRAEIPAIASQATSIAPGAYRRGTAGPLVDTTMEAV